MKGNHLKTLITAIAIFNMAYVNWDGAEDMIYHIRKMSKKEKEKKDGDGICGL